MKHMIFFLLLCFAAPAYGAMPERIVSVDGALTEIVFDLGYADKLVGTDTTSMYPSEAEALPKVGYKRALSAEGILSLNPDLVLATQEAGPPEVLLMIEQAGVATVNLPEAYSAQGVVDKARSVASALGLEQQEAEEYVEGLEQAFDDAVEQGRALERPPKVLFVFHAGGGSPLVAGNATGADAMIEMSGAVNVIDSYDGYRPLDPEFIAEADPDFILTTNMTIGKSGGKEKFASAPGIALTRAGRKGRIVTRDTLYLLGFGPRTPKAIKDLVNEWKSIQ